MLRKLRAFKLLERSAGGRAGARTFRYPGVREAVDGNAAVIACEREASDAAGAYPITPSTQMGEYWAEAAARGHINVSGRKLMFVEPESEHAAAGVTAGMAMTGLRATNFSSAQGVAFMHESLYAAAGKRLPYVLNMGCRAITKASLNVHCAHDDYHCVDDTGFIQVMAADAQEAADLNLIARKTAELSLTPAIVAQDGFLTTHLIESVRLPERELIAEYLGRPEDSIEPPTEAQRLLYGERRRRVPALWDVDNVMQSGVVQNQDAYMQAVAAQRPYFFDHVAALAERCMDEYFELTGRRYARVSGYRTEDAEYLLVGMGSMIVQAQAVADWLRERRGIRVGVVNLTMYRPFPGDRLAHLLCGRKAVTVLERTDQPLAEDLPLMRELRAALGKCMENGAAGGAEPPYPDYPVLARIADLPALYSGCYGLGSRDLQPEALIGAVENMLPGGAKRRFFYLSVDFVRAHPANPKEEIRQQRLIDAYPHIAALSVHGSENPDLMPKGAITVRIHSVGGWGAITTGKNLAVTLFDLLGYEVRANPKYGSEKKGQPTTYYLSAAPERIRINCEYRFVDVAISPDPNVFEHSDPLAGLKRGGVFIVQSVHESASEVWASFPQRARAYIREHDIRVFWLDAFRIAREEASNPELQLRMQGNAFQGAFFAASPVMAQAGLTEERLFTAIRAQMEAKFGGKGARVVEDNLRVVERGFRELRELGAKPEEAAAAKQPLQAGAGLPLMLARLPEGDGGVADVQRFWAETGSFYAGGKGGDILADPFVGVSVIPAATGALRDLTQIRFEHPAWKPEKCTACGNCYVACPDSAMPGLVSTVGDVLDTALRRVETGGRPTRHLRRALRAVEKDLRAAIMAGPAPDVRALLDAAIEGVIGRAGEERDKLSAEFELLRAQLGEFGFAVTKPYYTTREKKAPGSGALFNIGINPYTCKGCALCVEVCEDDALEMVPQTSASVERLRRDWRFWLDLPTTPPEYIRIDSLDEKIGALETLLLDKRNYTAMVCGDGACLGCGEKTAIHLFTATVRALMQPRVRAFVARLDELIERLEKHIRMKLTESLDLSQPSALAEAAARGGDLTLASLSARLAEGKAEAMLDPQWVRSAGSLLDALRELRARYREGKGGSARAEMGMVNSTGCTSVWGSTYPYNPYPFPWTSHLFQDSPSVAMGVFEGHMAKMAEAFKVVRRAELELSGEYDPAIHDTFFPAYGRNAFSGDEWRLCPPVVRLGGDGAMYDIGFQNLSRALISGMPIKVVVLDTQVYSNTGGQACTSGFIGQVSDMAPWGAAKHGKQETRKEISLVAAAHRTAFVLQGSVAHPTHLIEGFIDGLNSRRPALFNLYAVCPPEHGVADDQAVERSRIAVESRAYPLFRYDPDAGVRFQECVSLEGNPSPDSDWPRLRLAYRNEDGSEGALEVAMTFADFAAGEARFAKQFRPAPPETWNDDMIALADFLELSEDAREGRVPFLWAVDARNRLVRLLVSPEMVRATEERLRLWRQLKGLAGLDRTGLDEEGIASRARAQVVEELASTLARIGGAGLPVAAPVAPAAAAGAAAADFEPAWVDSPECTACDECTALAPKVFAYDESKHARVIDPKGGRYADIVKAAEKCTAGCIHPGTPWNPSEPGLDKLVVRAAKYH